MGKRHAMEAALAELLRVESGESQLSCVLFPVADQQAFLTTSGWEFHLSDYEGGWHSLEAAKPPNGSQLPDVLSDDIYDYDQEVAKEDGHEDARFALVNYAPPLEVWERVYRPVLEEGLKHRMSRGR